MDSDFPPTVALAVFTTTLSLEETVGVALVVLGVLAPPDMLWVVLGALAPLAQLLMTIIIMIRAGIDRKARL
jgi:hypothetical protein